MEIENLVQICLEQKKTQKESTASNDKSETITIEDEIEVSEKSVGKDVNECDDVKKELSQLRSDLKTAKEELDNEKKKEKEITSCNECDAKSSSKKKVEEQLELAHAAYNDTKKNLETVENVVEEKKIEIVHLQKEISELKAKLESPPVESNNESNPTNIRLKEFCVQLQKDKQKMIVVHDKEKKEIEKAKIDAEDNLKAAILENKDLKVRDDTLMGIYECLQNVINKKGDNVSQKSNTKETASSDNDGKKENSDNSATKDSKKCATMFVCEKCDFQSRSESVMNEHMKMDHQEQKKEIIYACDECEANFTSQTQFRNHAKTAHKKNSFTCDHCGSKSNSLEQLDNHISIYHNKQNIPCEFCTYKATNPGSLDKHIISNLCWKCS